MENKNPLSTVMSQNLVWRSLIQEKPENILPSYHFDRQLQVNSHILFGKLTFQHESECIADDRWFGPQRHDSCIRYSFRSKDTTTQSRATSVVDTFPSTPICRSSDNRQSMYFVAVIGGLLLKTHAAMFNMGVEKVHSGHVEAFKSYVLIRRRCHLAGSLGTARFTWLSLISVRIDTGGSGLDSNLSMYWCISSHP